MEFRYSDAVKVDFGSVDALRRAVFSEPGDEATELTLLAQEHTFGFGLEGSRLLLLPVEGQRIAASVLAQVRKIASQIS